MESLKFEVKWRKGGIVRKTFTVDAIEKHFSGIYYNGKPYGPNIAQVLENMPRNYEKAILRRNGFYTCDMSDIMLMHLCSLRDSDMGSIFARAIWKEKQCRLHGFTFGQLPAIAMQVCLNGNWTIVSDCGQVRIQVKNSIAESRFSERGTIPIFYYD
jgi:hypothetical protein